jgi:putative oxidoreductase
MDIVLVIGRVLFALLFISSGLAHFTQRDAMTGYAQFKKVPAAKFSVLLSGLVILLGGIYIAFGIYADLGALLLAIFLIPSAFMMHNFWTIEDAQAKQGEMINFMKNLSLAGAALILFALLATGTEFGPTVTESFFNLDK